MAYPHSCPLQFLNNCYRILDIVPTYGDGTGRPPSLEKQLAVNRMSY
jgi:phage portal protein BeeE